MNVMTMAQKEHNNETGWRRALCIEREGEKECGVREKRGAG